MKILIICSTILSLLLMSSLVFPQQYDWLTTFKIDDGWIRISDSEIDQQGNIFIVGAVWDNVNNYYSINKYSSQGTQIWSVAHLEWDHSNDALMTIDIDGDLYLLFEEHVLVLSSGGDSLLNFSHETRNIRKIIVDSEKNILLFGTWYDDNNYLGDFGAHIIKYNSQGLKLWDTVVYAVPVSAGPDVTFHDATIDSENNIYITGDYFQNGFMGFLTIKTGSNGTVQWTNKYIPPGYIRASGNKIILYNGNIFVTGFAGTENVTTTYDATTLAISPDGVRLWSNTFDFAGKYDEAFDIQPFSGGVVISGISNADDARPAFAVHYLENGNESWLTHDIGWRWSQASHPIQYLPDCAADLVTNSSEIFISGLIYDTNYDGHFNTIKLTQNGEITGRTTIPIEGVGYVVESFKYNDNIILACHDTDSISTKNYIKLISIESSTISAVPKNNGNISIHYMLAQNYPNPFNPTTTIRYTLPKQSNISLNVYNLRGQKITTLVNKTQLTGEYEAQWDASGLPSGVYICRLQAGEFVATRKLVLLK